MRKWQQLRTMLKGETLDQRAQKIRGLNLKKGTKLTAAILE